MHDISNAWMSTNDFQWTMKSALNAWGMNDDHVYFWPYWSNGDVIGTKLAEVKVSAWTLPDRVLLCVLNYNRAAKADNVTVTVNLKKLGVTLPADAALHHIEKSDKTIAMQQQGENAVITINTLAPHDYLLLAVDKK